MNQQRLTYVALAMSFAALVAALWVLLSGQDGEPHRRPERAARGDAGPTHVDVAPGQSRNLAESLAKHGVDGAGDRISGSVIDPHQGPVEGGIISFECVKTGRPIRGSNVRLDDDGRFESLGCGGPVCAQLRHPSYVQDEPWIVEPGRPVELFVRRMAHLEGRVWFEGKPVAGARITVVPAEEDPMALPPLVSRNAQSDADGSFALARVELPPCDRCAQARGQCSVGEARRDVLYRGPLSLLVTAPGFRAYTRELEDMPEAPLEIELAVDDSPVTGTLVGADGQRFARAEIIARSEARPHESHRVRVEGDQFDIAGLGDGMYTLRVLQDGQELLSVPGVSAGARLELEALRPAEGRRLRVRVVNAQADPVPDARVDGGPFGRGQTVDADGWAIAEQVLPGQYRVRAWHDGKTPVRATIDVPSFDRDDPRGGEALEVQLEL